MSVLHVPSSEAELSGLLRDSKGPVHLQGTASRNGFHPRTEGSTRVSLRAIDRIVHLEPGDLTCSVQPGLPMAALRAELEPHGIELGCLDGDGTVGGLFAADPWGAWTPGGATPRSLLLGMDAVLADGTTFRSGARVVKSVAGFDLHKLFVGSAGTLMAATLLHLRLHPRPRARIGFDAGSLALGEALARFHALRQLPLKPEVLVLEGSTGGPQRVHGRFGGRADSLRSILLAMDLREAPAEFTPTNLAHDGCDVLVGMVRASRLRALLEAMPAGSRWTVRGGMRFELTVPGPTALPTLDTVASLGGHARVRSADPTRDGRASASDPGADLLTDRLRRQLDPQGVLA